MIRSTWVSAFLAACALLSMSLRPVDPRPQVASSRPVDIPAPSGRVSGTLALPASSGYHTPVVLLIAASGTNLRALADALAASGIASLWYDTRTAPAAGEPDRRVDALAADAATAISFLRNDSRFGTIAIAGFGDTANVAAIAGRAARADAIISVADAAAAASSATMIVDRVRRPDGPGAAVQRRPIGPRVSLRDTMMATVDGCRIAVEYGRPSKRGRTIWGGLVAWGRWWMPGADEASTLTTDKTLAFGALVVPAGEYTIYTLPGDPSFQLIINTETGQFHTYHPAEYDLGRTPMVRETVDPPAERLTYAVQPRPGGGGVLKLIWDDRAYVAAFTVRP